LRHALLHVRRFQCSNDGVIQFDDNYGFTGGYNRALKQIDAEYFVLLNSDVEVSSGWIQPIIDLMDNKKEVGICQPKIKGYHQPTHFEYAGASGGFIDCLGYPFCRGRLFNSIEEDLHQYENPVGLSPCRNREIII
jgi:GT2 family glycosyltransferase